jgi:hypothetical protein
MERIRGGSGGGRLNEAESFGSLQHSTDRRAPIATKRTYAIVGASPQALSPAHPHPLRPQAVGVTGEPQAMSTRVDR